MGKAVDNIIKFFNGIEKLTDEFTDVYFTIKKTRNNGWWRIQVFGKCQAIVGYGKNRTIIGDSELLCVEDKDRNTAFNIATSKLDAIRLQVGSLKSNPLRMNIGEEE